MNKDLEYLPCDYNNEEYALLLKTILDEELEEYAKDMEANYWIDYYKSNPDE